MEGLGTRRKDPLIEKKLLLSGWCMDSLHERCAEFYYGKWSDHDCSCKCHT